MVRKNNMNPYFKKANPIIYNQNTYNTKEKLFKESQLLCREFFICNNLSVPEIVEKQHYLKPNATGYYDNYRQIVHINLNKCKKPESEYSQNYTFPGWRYDSTPLGVLAKQCGYHLDNILENPSLDKTWCNIFESSIFKKDESYLNDFSECVRLFITNPGLLKRGRPQKWQYFTKYLKIKPVFDLNWDEILLYCDYESKESIRRWFLT